jgi:hypothetical protein
MAFVAAQALIIFSCSCYLAQDMDKRRAVVNVVNEHYGSTKRTARLDKLRKCHNLIIQKKKIQLCLYENSLHSSINGVVIARMEGQNCVYNKKLVCAGIAFRKINLLLHNVMSSLKTERLKTDFAPFICCFLIKIIINILEEFAFQ